MSRAVLKAETYRQLAFSHPELLEQRAALQALDVTYVLAQYCELRKLWEEREANHSRVTREEHFQGRHRTAFVGNFLMGNAIGHALLVVAMI